MQGGAEFVAGREDAGAFLSIAAGGARWRKEFGRWMADRPAGACRHVVICYRNFRRAADKPIPPGKRALVRITVEVLKILDD